MNIPTNPRLHFYPLNLQPYLERLPPAARPRAKALLTGMAVSSTPMVMKFVWPDGRIQFLAQSEIPPELLQTLEENHRTGLDAQRDRKQAWAEYLFRKLHRRQKVSHKELLATIGTSGPIEDYEALGIIERDGKHWQLVPLEHPPLRWVEYDISIDCFTEHW